MQEVSMRSFVLCLALAVAAPAAVAAPRSFTVDVQGSGPPVILIPGLACGGAVWAPTVARYRDKHQLHVLTLAGFAGQKAIDAPLLPTVRSELAAYIKERKLDKPVIVGHSLGGFVALWLAATEPALVGKVVVVDALPFLAAARLPTATVETVKPRAQMMRDMLIKSPPEMFAAQNRAAVTAMVTNPKDVEPLAEMGKKSDQAAVATAMYELMITDLRPLLPKVRAPTLVLVANDGPDFEKTFAAQYASLPKVKLKLAAHARHFIFVDDPAFFFAAVDEVLR
jgi:pimeloyl-ACP methyl ester carboxylesterase